MKIFHRISKCIFTAILIIISSIFSSFQPAAASANDFHFKSFEADYYLEKDSEGNSILRVEEVLTAIFPEYDQNHGIERVIPYIHKNGEQFTIENASPSNLHLGVRRNGIKEPYEITEISKSDFTVRIGSPSTYVKGEQTYNISYIFTNVVTNYDDSSLDELYWDTNGNGWYQSFDSLTARLHMSDDILKNWTGESWCYVGEYGGKDQTRCEITKLKDGVMFTTGNLAPTENLTFDTQFALGTFSIKTTPKKWGYVIFLGTMLLIAIMIPIIAIALNKDYKEKRNQYKSTFIAPQYQPDPDYDILEAAKISIKPTKNSKVAALIDLAVKKKIQIIKENSRWKVRILSLDDISDEQKTVLKILNGAHSVDVGDIITIKQQQYSSSASSMSKVLDKHIDIKLKEKEYLEEKTHAASSKIVGLTFCFALFCWFFLYDIAAGLIKLPNVVLGDYEILYFIATILPFATSWIVVDKEKYIDKTEKGIKAAKYLEGLELYIKMAEKDRLAFFQSVNNAELTNQGIVNLYEKLLPYAILFGQEKTWLKELEKYYQFSDVSSPVWFYGSGHFRYYELNHFINRANRSLYSATKVSSSSASGFSSSSSGFSGGGGGGFSGGGGGGGGGGGW